MIVLVTVLGLVIALSTLAAIAWSILHPARRIWPPQHYDERCTPILVWVPTFALAGIIVWLGFAQWGTLDLPLWLRWGVGLPMILVANVAVWFEVVRFGMHQTGGAVGPLRAEGLYRWSRNPQYVADAVMVVGWVLLSASPNAILIGAFTIVGLLVAPLAEEPWMAERHGKAWHDYAGRVRRYV